MCNILVVIALMLILHIKDFTQVPQPWPASVSHILMILIVIPFVLGFPGKGHTFREYFSEIRLTKNKPLLRLILLGLSCYLIFALSQITGVLIYRLMQGLPVDESFIRSSFVLTNELPPHSISWRISISSIFEEVVWRGVILAAFLRIYDQRKAIIFSAICFGLMHSLGILDGYTSIWILGNVVWAAILGLFYGYITLKTNSLLPVIMVHYLGNLFVSATNAYIQANASDQALAVYGIIFTFGIIPTALMIVWTHFFTARWMPSKT